MGLFNLFKKKNTLEIEPSASPIKAKHTPTTNGWEKSYIDKLPIGLKAAGYAIQKYFQDNHITEPAFRWIQTSLTYPAFQHLCFAHEGNIYSVLIEFDDGESSYILERDLQNQIMECKNNDLIPCTIILRYDNYAPIINGNHLIYSDKRTPVKFDKRTGNIKMSPWEINNFGVSIVVESLKKEGFEIGSYCDVMNIEPNIWFKDTNGEKCYVIVKTISGSSIGNINYQVNHELLMKFIDYNGYFAKVGISPAEKVYSEDSELNQNTKQFNTETPMGVLYRDKKFYIKYGGLEYIEKYAAEKGTIQRKLYNIK